MAEKILIVDDDTVFLSLFQKQLKSQGFEAQIAASGNDGLEWVRKETFDIVFVDLIMPEMDGVHLCNLVKRICPESNVILTSSSPGNVSKRLLEFWRVGGRREILKKPVQIEALQELIEKLRAEKTQSKQTAPKN